MEISGTLLLTGLKPKSELRKAFLESRDHGFKKGNHLSPNQRLSLNESK